MQRGFAFSPFPSMVHQFLSAFLFQLKTESRNVLQTRKFRKSVTILISCLSLILKSYGLSLKWYAVKVSGPNLLLFIVLLIVKHSLLWPSWNMNGVGSRWYTFFCNTDCNSLKWNCHKCLLPFILHSIVQKYLKQVTCGHFPNYSLPFCYVTQYFRICMTVKTWSRKITLPFFSFLHGKML